MNDLTKESYLELVKTFASEAKELGESPLEYIAGSQYTTHPSKAIELLGVSPNALNASAGKVSVVGQSAAATLLEMATNAIVADMESAMRNMD